MSEKPTIYCCVNRRPPSQSSCAGRGSEALVEKLRELAGDRLEVVTQTCMGKCDFGPTMKRLPGGMFLGVSESDLQRLVDGDLPSNDKPEQGDGD